MRKSYPQEQDHWKDDCSYSKAQRASKSAPVQQMGRGYATLLSSGHGAIAHAPPAFADSTRRSLEGIERLKEDGTASPARAAAIDEWRLTDSIAA